MRSPFLILAALLLGTALVLLLVFGNSGEIAGIDSDVFARSAYLVVIGLMVGSALVFGRGRIHPRLWHVAVWLAIFVGLAAGYRYVNGPDIFINPSSEMRSA